MADTGPIVIIRAGAAKLAVAWRELAHALRTYGIKRTGAIVLNRVLDHGFDLYFGTDTASRVPVEHLGVSSPHLRESRQYQPTGMAPFFAMVRKCVLPRDPVFVDFGCGKGQVLLMAAFFPFKRIVGIEFSPRLCRIAAGNLGLLRRKVGRKAPPVEIRRIDAAKYRFRGDENVFYFFNPFGEKVMKKALRNINASLARRPRKALILYYFPAHRGLVARYCPLFKKREDRMMGGYDLSIFESR